VTIFLDINHSPFTDGLSFTGKFLPSNIFVVWLTRI